MYKRNENKGITLIALVITIIVLLILAGVSIAMLSGENSILSNATKARRDKAIGDVKEQVLLAVNTAFTEYNAKLATNELEEGKKLYDYLNDALSESNLKSNNNEVEYHYSSNTVTIKYKRDNTTLTGTLDQETGKFNWNQ